MLAFRVMAWNFEGTLLPSGLPGSIIVGSGKMSSLPGRYALVGLVDGHCHLTLSQDDAFPYLDRAGVPDRMHRLAAAGVSLVRDLGGDRSITLRLGQAEQPGMPRVLAAGRFLAPEGGYFPGLYDPVPASALVSAVEGEIRDGAPWVKLVADFPLLSQNVVGPATANYSYDMVAAAVKAAHRAGARVAAHTTTDTVSSLVQAGIDSVEHGNSTLR